MENTVAGGFSQKSNRPEAGKNISYLAGHLSVRTLWCFYAETGRGNEVAGRRGFKVRDVVRCAN
jgi:hypothetical protein